MRHCSIIFFILVYCIVGSQTVSAQNLTFKQQILPLDCVFEQVNDGLGTIQYLTPETCGVILPPAVIPPAATGSQPETGSSSGYYTGSQPSSTIVYPSRTIRQRDSNPADTRSGVVPTLLLNNISTMLQNGGDIVQVQVGSTFFYRPVDSPQAAIRSLTVTAINASGVTLTSQQTGVSFHLGIGQARTYDKLQTGQPALGIRLEILRAPQSASLRLQLLANNSSGSYTTSTAVRIVMITGLIFSIIGMGLKPKIFGLNGRGH